MSVLRGPFHLGSRLALPLGILAWAAWVPSGERAPDLAGSWHGTSTCVDKVHFPACHDEEVIYDARQKGEAPDTVTVRADKVVDGVREPMGEFDFHLVPDTTWVAQVQNPRVRIRIVLRVRGTHLTGSLTDEGSGRRVRDIAADRIPG